MTAKPKARLITMAWGEGYFARLLDLTLPAILAPGNLPALAEHFDCELVVVTEQRYFAWLVGSPVFRRIRRHCRAWPVPVDDLIVSRKMYGHSLTFALHRGFEDLGERVTDTFLLFFNADFILADGCYRSLAKYMLAGERLMFAPSYCVVAEAVAPLLRNRVDPKTHVLAVPRRELAEIALENRHNCVRAKTINRPLIRMTISDQFYWQVDDHTLVGRQMPVAIVGMKPEKLYPEPVSFWDYATLSMACPTANRCVIGDSDEFLMIELRNRDAMMELMEIGRPEPGEIARVLGGYMTADQFELGHYPLVLHSRDLPPQTAAGEAALAAFVEEVYRQLPPEPVSYIDHPYWDGLIHAFRKNREEWRRQQERRPDAAADPDHAADAFMPRIVNPPGATATNARDSLARRLYRKVFGTLPRVTRFHPYWADLHRAAESLANAIAAPNLRTLILKSADAFLCRMVETACGHHLLVSPYAITNFPLPDDAYELDLCLAELSWPDVNNFAAYYEAIRPRMRSGGKILLFHVSKQVREFTKKDTKALRQIIPTVDFANVYFTGSARVAAAIDRHQRGLDRGARARRFGRLWVVTTMVLNAARCLAANRAAAFPPAHEMPDMCTGITVEIDIP